MKERLSFLFGGPVVRLELARAPHLLRIFVRIVLLFFLATSLLGTLSRRVDNRPIASATFRAAWPPRSFEALLESRRQEHLEVVKAAAAYVPWFLQAQLVLILLATPCLCAPAIVHEKEADTLQALFGTELRSREIAVGKLLGGLLQVLTEYLAFAPILVLAAVIAELPLVRVGLAEVQAALVAFALAAGCQCVSLWTRRPADAIVGCYSVMIVGYLVGAVALSVTTLPDMPNPVFQLSSLLDSRRELHLGGLAAHFAFLFGCGIVFLAVTAFRLRPVCLGQTEVRSRRWLSVLRPPVGDDPIAWRERHVLGLAPVAVLRTIPQWLVLLGVFAFSVILASSALHPVFSWRRFFSTVGNGEVRSALRDFYSCITLDDSRGAECIHLMGAALVVLGGLTVCVRCATSVIEEKRRKTWDDLMLTSLSYTEILQAKYQGILGAAVLPALAYCVPMFLLGGIQGWLGWIRAAAWLVAACVIIPLAGTIGSSLAEGQQTSADYEMTSILDSFRIPPILEHDSSDVKSLYRRCVSRANLG
jgi:ABC-type Na+ efflux pump permease subunit